MFQVKLARCLSLLVPLFLAACATSGVSPTGLYGDPVQCVEGPRQTLDCRGAAEQYKRDIRADFSYVGQATAGVGLSTTKLMEADALSTDLKEQYFHLCAQYNACLISRQEFVEKTERLREIQARVRNAAYGYFAGQNIQINPPPYGVPPPMGGYPPPGGVSFPPPPQSGMPQPSGSVSAPASPAPTPGGVVGSTPSQQDRVDAILNILREGNRLLKEKGPTPPGSSLPDQIKSASVAPLPESAALGIASTPRPEQDLDGSLRSMLVSLKETIAQQHPTLAVGRTVVGNITEEGQTWASPLGAFLQERVARLVEEESIFKPVLALRTRGITITQVAAADHPNDPKSLGALYQADMAIMGRFKPVGEQVEVQLAALDGAGTSELAKVTGVISALAIPSTLPVTATNAAETGQLLQSLNQLGQQSGNGRRVEITTNRPGLGTSFKRGEEIRYFVTSSLDGYLYLFHVDAEGGIKRVFPNMYQRETRIEAGAWVQVPGPGAPFKFEASTPYGLETTFAIVTDAMLDERE
ncbi:MAG: DUF4384 domain-containing protein, partial [candidate division NC10 bacterium]|nr:DUF4384 domain-containing protein [candidate division NC10 bacterium]